MDPVHSTPVDKWREVMAINLDSVFYVCRLVLQQMKKQQYGSIVTVSSVFGMGGTPDAHTYTATKGAIINLTRSMAVAYIDDNIRVNSVAPGFIQNAHGRERPGLVVLAGESQILRADRKARDARGNRLCMLVSGVR